VLSFTNTAWAIAFTGLCACVVKVVKEANKNAKKTSILFKIEN
jgi:hypothetical protein